ncbi:3-hydroxyacyl-CoA dehydrogenase [Longispora fulva]|uniref:3-hydroxyacyl-CoA dehydrogenase/enoyl-CoA hydratase/carnithine racemase n=1 Tax=Longispora fulva TaxID=619741 RepID=A0A8J7KXL3_9ACTN|nr:3-hydroxyacyl-CoA dehydrogenase NAD-binding domain-containing protein [Longispora fulva]MBG6138002.1 3-hydroxyacyl-CoA dehydrogenase/enoyl-CoA hydratase/carnithine racemase [Longispora fulva]GIG60255.1 3-hydroxyacyl-CoA dehydrogenase [Longispora fulva]
MTEVVTKALLRFVSVPGQAGKAALITLDNGLDYKKPNTFGPEGLASLDAAFDEAIAAGPAFIAVTGKPYIFSVGADITGIPQVTDREQALEIGRLGHAVFAKFKNSAVPTFAFVNGAAMGGGLELSLHCHYRAISTGAAALALPECFLGLVPGWGGTQLLPNLIGPANAAKVIIENPLSQNRMLKPADALKLGIADTLFEPADFLERSLAWAASVVAGTVTVERAEIDRGPAWSAVIGYAKKLLDEKLHGAAPAPYRALELMELARTATFEDGTAAEDEALADMIFSPELRAGLYSFDLVQRRAKRPAGAPDPDDGRDVNKVGVVGAGLMASQLALLFASRLEVPVVLTDLDQERVDKGVAYVNAEIDKLVAKNKMMPGKAAKLRGLVSGSVTKEAFADADLVIEAVFENLAVKKQVFAEVEAVVSESCVLATNTSSLSITEMAADLKHPERVVGLHFFNPVAAMPLLEIVRAEKTDEESLATAFAVGKALRKSSVLVADRPAFVVNRLLTRFLGEILGAVEEGTDFTVADQAVDSLGMPMRPLTLVGLVGPAVALHVAETLHEAFPDRFAVSQKLGKLVEAGLTSFHTADGALDPRVVEIYGPREGGPTGEELKERALTAVAEEIRLMLEEGVVADAKDIDLCMILGAGWPFHLGGITPYLRKVGKL